MIDRFRCSGPQDSLRQERLRRPEHPWMSLQISMNKQQTVGQLVIRVSCLRNPIINKMSKDNTISTSNQ